MGKANRSHAGTVLRKLGPVTYLVDVGKIQIDQVRSRIGEMCQLHITSNDFVEGLAALTMTKRKRLRLRPNVPPSVFNNHSEIAEPKVTKRSENYRASVRQFIENGRNQKR